jgi:Sec-independent protein translocase protein TatA
VNDIMIILIIVLVAVLLIRGPRMLPKIGEAFGRGVKETRKEMAKGFGPESEDADGSTPAKP